MSRWSRSRARRLVVAVGLLGAAAGCAGPQHKPDGDSAHDPPTPVADTRTAVTDTRTPIEKRREVACEQLGPKITACAVEDAKADLAAGKIQKPQFDADTAPAVQHKNTEEFLKACKATAYSSRQIRVLEVCFRDEPRCGPLLECLGHLSDAEPAKH